MDEYTLIDGNGNEHAINDVAIDDDNAAIEFSAEFRTAPPGTCSLRRNGDGAIVHIVLNQFNFHNGSVRWGALALVR